jgi:hypothetical protein
MQGLRLPRLGLVSKADEIKDNGNARCSSPVSNCMSKYEKVRNHILRLQKPPLTICQVLRKHFGLEVFIMRQTIPSNMHLTLGRYLSREEPQQETFAFLTLPCKHRAQDILAIDAEQSEWDFQVDSSTGLLDVIDLASLVINEEQKRRFHKAMSFLGLKPKIRRMQVLDDHDKDGPILTRDQKNAGVHKEDVEAVQARLDARVKGELLSAQSAKASLVQMQLFRAEDLTL